jgi:hypothetical protein
LVCVSGGVDPAILTGCEANGRGSYGVTGFGGGPEALLLLFI